MFKYTHSVVGTIFLIMFIATGFYMFFNFPDLYEGREEIRMMYRATHIYILFAAVTNLLVGQNLESYLNSLAIIQALASSLILASPFLVFLGFLFESPSYLIDRPYSYWGIVFLFTGTVVILILRLPWLKRYRT